MIVRRAGTIRGVVQGVGFRPLVARLASELELAGFVRNRGPRVEVELEGEPGAIDRFARRLRAELPPAATIDAMEWSERALTGEQRFTIEESGPESPGLAIPPDLAVCAECLAEALDPGARRHRYPFTNCTRCGPRFTIAEAAPWDRERTTMAAFAMCAECAAEHGDPSDRRHHAQPIACPRCGPTLRLTDPAGERLASREAALDQSAEAIRRGAIVALMGLGGFQLLVRADDESAVRRLRQRKRRPAKPFALLVPDLGAARALAVVGDAETRALTHPAAPIVLLERRGDGATAPAVAPDVRRLGVMLPATPLHALLARALPFPLVCTSGNLHDEPICIDEARGRERLGAVADLFLVHDRPIARRADDSVVHVVGGRMRALRVARGLAPVALSFGAARTPVLGLGGHLKQAPVLADGGRAVLWPQVGDLHTAGAREAMAESLVDLERFLGRRATTIACDAHPDYATTLWAEASGRPMAPVWHHHAHVGAVLAEHGEEKALGFAWDGTGLGPDGTSWGGETLAVDRSGARRLGHLLPFPLIGGDAAARDGRRVLAGLLYAAGIEAPPALERFTRLAPRAARTSSMGRLFDGVAALVGVAERSRFEGEAAMALEAIAEPGAAPYELPTDEGTIDWRPMLRAMHAGRADAITVASRFHATLAHLVAREAEAHGARQVALAGGCFQNALLLEGAMAALRERAIEPLVGERVPPGDGGLALGQAWVASCALDSSQPRKGSR